MHTCNIVLPPEGSHNWLSLQLNLCLMLLKTYQRSSVNKLIIYLWYSRKALKNKKVNSPSLYRPQKIRIKLLWQVEDIHIKHMNSLTLLKLLIHFQCMVNFIKCTCNKQSIEICINIYNWMYGFICFICLSRKISNLWFYFTLSKILRAARWCNYSVFSS